ncbi:hypothetical protein [Wolbachia endosymbiont of Psylliodes chrysocephala]|uniref:hypothetical protein n=1 Tax=Wolbachia endosymbiont of Psylliodes chrysocephala TaxID=2883236 RepID=UPI0020A1B7CB|nr:hypothetical protein [Wolbachia endosymbiont of Psylliodes chrysocephala]
MRRAIFQAKVMPLRAMQQTFIFVGNSKLSIDPANKQRDDGCQASTPMMSFK